MRCLHCGKELALLKRWTRGEFCSEAHKQSYQEEYNRMGLSRLLQAQPKVANAKTQQSRDKTPLSETPVLVQEPPVEVVEEALELQESTPELVAAATEEVKQESAWEPDEMANFVRENQPAPLSVEVAPYLEPWQRGLTAPVSPTWIFEGREETTLPAAGVIELKFRPNLSDTEHSAPEVKVTANQFVQSQAIPPALAAILAANKLPEAGPVEVNIDPQSGEWSTVENLAGLFSSPGEVAFRNSALLVLVPSIIAFPPADADVNVTGATEGSVSELGDSASQEADIPVLESEPAWQSAAPVEALEDLARLQQELVEHHEQAAVEAPQEPRVEDVAAVEEAAPVKNVIESAPSVEEAPQAVDASPTPEEGAPHKMGEFVEIPVKSYAPPKPSPREGAGALVETPSFLPRLAGLPLRPKVALAQQPGLPSKKVAVRDAAPEVKAKEAPAVTARPDVSPKTWAKPAQRMSSTSPATQEAVPAVKVVRPAEPPKMQPSPVAKAAPAVPAKTEAGKQAAKTSIAPKPPEKVQAAPVVKPSQASRVMEETPANIEGPSFGAGQMGSTSLMGSLKGKLAIAAVVLVMAGAAYFVVGGKPHAPTVNPGAAAEKSGPSIMVGGGGWVEGWAGDPSGMHLGRQITLYRPSLKLSDYRIEFKAEIETKSLGWVFRASDPDNYYAMKLAMVTAGLSPKIALFKYLVANGRQTQVGRVPVDQDVRLDTLYSVRVDVQGPRFTTYVQGQQVDSWTDDQLKSGGVGFLNERDERGRVKSVSVSLLNAGKK
jgi:hypothetical protein